MLEKQAEEHGQGGLPGNRAENGGINPLGLFDKFLYGPFFNFFVSILVLSWLIRNREIVTPDFCHLITHMEDDEVHFTWILSLWIVFKCFL